MATRISDKDKQTILQLREDGLSYAKIGTRVSRSEEGVRLICNLAAREKSRTYTAGYHATHREQERIHAHEWRVTHPEEARKHDRLQHAKHKMKRNAQSRKYKADHPEEMVAYSRRYVIEHREERRQYCIENREHDRIRFRKYRDLHRERYREHGRKYAHTERGRVHAKNTTHKRRERLGNGKGLTIEDWRQLWTKQQGRCCYCGQPMLKYEDIEGTLFQTTAYNSQPNYCNIDHVIPISRGGLHELSNIVLACRKCNIEKGASLLQPQLEEVLV